VKSSPSSSAQNKLGYPRARVCQLLKWLRPVEGTIIISLKISWRTNELSELQNVELEAGDELCYSIAWENLITGDSGSSAPVCFTQEQVEVIEHRVPSNESLNEGAAMCFALSEGYPKESGDDPNTETDRAVSNDDGCQQRSGSPWGLGLWLCALALWIRRRALRLA